MLQRCAHLNETGPVYTRACAHVVSDHDAPNWMRFSGVGTEVAFVCAACREVDFTTLTGGVCEGCSSAVRPMNAEGAIGAPQSIVSAEPLWLSERNVTVEGLPLLRALVARPSAAATQWLGVDAEANLWLLSTQLAKAERLVRLEAFDAPSKQAAALTLVCSPCGRYLAVAETRGRFGLVVHLDKQAVTMTLDRGDYHTERCDFSVAFAEHAGATRLVHATAWNRLDISDPESGRCLTPRVAIDGGALRLANYFHGALHVAPDGRSLVDDGWVWAPVGITQAYDLDEWIERNAWETDQHPRPLREAHYAWSHGMCFIDATTLAVWGVGGDDEWMRDAVSLIDVRTGRTLRWFAGVPDGRFSYDGHLIVMSPSRGTSVWNVTTGERLLEAPELQPLAHHPGAHLLLSQSGPGQLREHRIIE